MKTDRNRWLFISGRNFGDALLVRCLVNAVLRSKPRAEIHVLGRPQHRYILLDGVDGAVFHAAQFPMGTTKGFSLVEARELWGTMSRLRRLRFDICVNNSGDIRESLLGKLSGASENFGPIWEPGHPYRRLIRAAGVRYLLDDTVSVPSSCPNVYDAHLKMARSLGEADLCLDDLVSGFGRTLKRRAEHVGLHPSATQECRLWPRDKWIELAERLLALGLEVSVFGSEGERAQLRTEFGHLVERERFSICVGGLESFLRALSGIGVMVALDSFAMHAAFFGGCRVVVINGANDSRIWAPPGSVVLENGGSCPRYPCYNSPSCGDGLVGLYSCIRAIPVERVLEKVVAASAI